MHIVACVELQMGNESFRMCCTDFIFTFHLAVFLPFLTLRQLLQLTVLTKCPEISACYCVCVCICVCEIEMLGLHCIKCYCCVTILHFQYIRSLVVMLS
jgi:hypothetical protein